jgi:hypothetical protein
MRALVLLAGALACTGGTSTYPIRCATSCAAHTQQNAITAATALQSIDRPTDGDSPGSTGTGVTSSAMNGRAISVPSRDAQPPNRRIQIDSPRAATNSTSAAFGCSMNSRPTSLHAMETIGSVASETSRCRVPPWRWVRPSVIPSTVVSTTIAGPRCWTWSSSQRPSRSRAAVVTACTTEGRILRSAYDFDAISTRSPLN